MPINHAKEASVDNKFGIADLNADHKITNMLGYELVEEKDLPAGTTTCTFSNLDGDSDVEYLLEGDISIIANGADRLIYLYPNNVSSGFSGSRHHIYQSGSIGYESLSTFYVVANGWNSDSNNHFDCKILAKTGVMRLFKSETIDAIPNHNGGQTINCVWSDTITNITSLVLLITSGGSFSGKIRLWKRIPIE